MREILFRGKRVDNGEWVEGYLYVTNGGEYEISSYNPKFEMERWTYIVDPSTVGQYTGLKDKNGKRIFEGDIVRHHNDSPYAIPDIIEKGKVYCDKEYCGWRRTSNGEFHHGVIDTYRMSRECVYEVIGNIHDPSELMEDRNEQS